MYNVNSVYLSIGVVHHPSILSGQVGAHGCVGNVQQDHLLLLVIINHHNGNDEALLKLVKIGTLSFFF